MISFTNLIDNITQLEQKLASTYPYWFGFWGDVTLYGIVALVFGGVLLYNESTLAPFIIIRFIRHSYQAWLVNIASGVKEIEIYATYFGWAYIITDMSYRLLSLSILYCRLDKKIKNQTINAQNNEGETNQGEIEEQKIVENNTTTTNWIKSAYRIVIDGFEFPARVTGAIFIGVLLCDVGIEVLVDNIWMNYRYVFWERNLSSLITAVPDIMSEFALHKLFYVSYNTFSIFCSIVAGVGNLVQNFNLLYNDLDLAYAVVACIVLTSLHIFIHYFVEYVKLNLAYEQRAFIHIMRTPIDLLLFGRFYDLSWKGFQLFQYEFLSTLKLRMLFVLIIAVRVYIKYYVYYEFKTKEWIRWTRLKSNAFSYFERFVMRYTLGENFNKVSRNIGTTRLLSISGLMNLVRHSWSIMRNYVN